MSNFLKKLQYTHNNCTWVGSNWTVTKIVVICGNDWYKAKGVDLLTLASYCVLMDIPIPVYVAISWQKNHTTVALDVLNKRSATSHLFFSTSTPCITNISLRHFFLLFMYTKNMVRFENFWPNPKNPIWKPCLKLEKKYNSVEYFLCSHRYKATWV